MMRNSCTNNTCCKVEGVDTRAILPPFRANDRHQVIVRNTFIDVDEGEHSPPIRKARAQTSVSDLLRFMEAKSAQGHEEGVSIEPERVLVVGVDRAVESGQRDDEELSFELITCHSNQRITRSGESSDSDDSKERKSLSQDHGNRTITIRNTFVSIDDDDTTPVQRQEKRAQTWHVRPLMGDTQSALVVEFDDDSEPQSQTDEDVTPVSSNCFQSERECCCGLPSRVQAPPPLCRINSSMSSTSTSPPQTLSTISSSCTQASPCEIGHTPSIASDASTSNESGCGSVLSFSQRIGSLSMEVLSTATPSTNAPSDVQQCRCADLPQQSIHASQPSLNGGIGYDVMPLYAFPCAPSIAFQAVPTTPFQSLEIGCPLLPSIGSAGHHKGFCKPCAFGKERCRNGAACEFCHICKPIETKKGGRWILKRRKQKTELMSEALDLQNVLCSAFAKNTDATRA